MHWRCNWWISLNSKRGNTNKNEDDDDVYLPASNRDNIEGESNEAAEEYLFEKAPSRYVQKNHPESQIFGEKGWSVQIGRTLVGSPSYLEFLSTIEP